MNKLQNKYYNALVGGLNLDEQTFQIAQGSPYLEDDESVWAVMDTVPPKSLTNQFHMSGKTFYQVYRDLVYNIESLQGNPFKEAMGLDYKKWKRWLSHNQDKIGTGTSKMDLFESWASINLSPAKRQKAIEAMRRVQHNTVNEAQQKVAENGPEGDTDVGPYHQGIDELINQTQASSGGFSLDTQKQSSDVEHTWAKGEAELDFPFISAEGSASYEKVSKESVSSHVTFDVEFDNVTSPAFGPTPAGWRDNTALAFAYNNEDAWVDDSKLSQSDFFGPTGALNRYAHSIVAVSGMDATLTVHREYSKDVREELTGEGSVNVWPFFNVDVGAGKKSHVHFSDDHHMKVTFNTDPTDLTVLGVNVSPIDSLVGEVEDAD